MKEHLLYKIKLYIRKLIEFPKFFFYLIFDSFLKSPSVSTVPQSLLLVKLDAIGDYILFRNFLELIRHSDKYKNYKITLCGNVAWKNIALQLDSKWVDEWIWIEKESFIKRLSYRKSCLNEIRKIGYEIVLCPVYSRDPYFEDSIVKAAHAEIKIGSTGSINNIQSWEKKIMDKFYTKLIPATSQIIFEFNRNKEFFEGFLVQPALVSKPIINLNAQKSEIAEPYVVLFPGAGRSYRQWNAENYALIANHIIDRFNLKVVIGGGTAELAIADTIISYVKNKEMVVSIAGKNSLVDFIKILKNTKLLISNETGAVHMAAALDVNTICISNGNHFGRFNPYPKDISDKIEYFYPEYIEVRKNDKEFLKEKFKVRSTLNINTISPSKVISRVDQLLGI